MTPTFVIVGAGGLGTPLAAALAGAGRLILVDHDVVDLSNLHRQLLFRTEDVGRPKAEAAKDALLRRGARDVVAVHARFDAGSGPALVDEATVVCEGSDDAATKFLVNDLAVAAGKPFVVGAAVRESGQVFPVRVGEACYRCLFETPPDDDQGETCAALGVLGPICGRVAALQARAALALAGGGDPGGVLGRFWRLERGALRSFAIRPRRGCRACDKEAA